MTESSWSQAADHASQVAGDLWDSAASGAEGLANEVAAAADHYILNDDAATMDRGDAASAAYAASSSSFDAASEQAAYTLEAIDPTQGTGDSGSGAGDAADWQ